MPFNLVCNAGYYKTGSSCELCTGNKIKSMRGDSADCTTDTTCDGTTKVPNLGHTACGNPNVIFFILVINKKRNI